MLEMWLSKERLLSNSTPRFLTDDEEFTEQPSSVRQCSRLLHVGVLGLIIFQNLAVRNYSSSRARNELFYLVALVLPTLKS